MCHSHGISTLPHLHLHVNPNIYSCFINQHIFARVACTGEECPATAMFIESYGHSVHVVVTLQSWSTLRDSRITVAINDIGSYVYRYLFFLSINFFLNKKSEFWKYIFEISFHPWFFLFFFALSRKNMISSRKLTENFRIFKNVLLFFRPFCWAGACELGIKN